MHAIFLFAFCGGPSVLVQLTNQPIKKQTFTVPILQGVPYYLFEAIHCTFRISRIQKAGKNTCAFFGYKLLSSVRRNECWCWTRVHCIHSVDWWRRWAVTNRNPRRVIRSNTTPLYFISQVNRFSDIFSFPLGTTILKPRFDLFVAELKRLCQHIPLSNGKILIHHEFFLKTF